MSNREIGKQLHRSPFTVRHHVSQLIKKLGAANRAEVAAIAVDRGLIVALSVHEDLRDAALASGVVGFAFNDEPPTRLLETIRELRRDKNQGIILNGTGT